MPFAYYFHRLMALFLTTVTTFSLAGQAETKTPNPPVLEEMAVESWQHYKKWWLADLNQEAWIYGGSGALISIAIATQDANWQGEVARARSSFRDHLANGVEPLGNPYWILPLSGLVYTGTALWGDTEGRRVAGNAFRSLVATATITVLLKQVAGRGRPRDHPGAPYQFRGPNFLKDWDSFPSGHAALAFSLASSLSQSWKDRWYMAIPLYSAAALVGWQRIYSKNHWPSDVIAGAAIGTLVGRGLGRASDELQLTAIPLFTGDLGFALTWRLN